MDWTDSLRQLDGSQLQTSSAERESRGIAPGLDSSETFEVRRHLHWSFRVWFMVLS